MRQDAYDHDDLDEEEYDDDEEYDDEEYDEERGHETHHTTTGHHAEMSGEARRHRTIAPPVVSCGRGPCACSSSRLICHV